MYIYIYDIFRNKYIYIYIFMKANKHKSMSVLRTKMVDR